MLVIKKECNKELMVIKRECNKELVVNNRLICSKCPQSLGGGSYLTKFYRRGSNRKFPRSNPFPSIDKMVPFLLCLLVHGGREYCMTPAQTAAKETISIAT